MDKIVTSVKQVVDLMSEIAAASQEQSPSNRSTRPSRKWMKSRSRTPPR